MFKRIFLFNKIPVLHPITDIPVRWKNSYEDRLAALNRRRFIPGAWVVIAICLYYTIRNMVTDGLVQRDLYLIHWIAMFGVSAFYLIVAGLILSKSAGHRAVEFIYSSIILIWTANLAAISTAVYGDRSTLFAGIMSISILYRGHVRCLGVMFAFAAAAHIAFQYYFFHMVPPGIDFMLPFVFAAIGGFLSVVLNDAERRTFVLEEQLRERNGELREISFRDPLTGLYNRRYMDEVLFQQVRVCSRGDSRLSLAVLDIDHFKRVNDRCGHTIGDRVLVKIAALVTNSLRTSDIVARFGGEEFLLIFPGVSLLHAIQAADRVRIAIESASWPEVGFGVTVSLGVAELESQEDEVSLVHRADECLYAAKRNGRNRVESGV